MTQRNDILLGLAGPIAELAAELRVAIAHRGDGDPVFYAAIDQAGEGPVIVTVAVFPHIAAIWGEADKRAGRGPTLRQRKGTAAAQAESLMVECLVHLRAFRLQWRVDGAPS